MLKSYETNKLKIRCGKREARSLLVFNKNETVIDSCGVIHVEETYYYFRYKKRTISKVFRRGYQVLYVYSATRESNQNKINDLSMTL